MNKKLSISKIKNSYFELFCNIINNSKVNYDYYTDEQTIVKNGSALFTIDYSNGTVSFHLPILQNLGLKEIKESNIETITDLILYEAIEKYRIRSNNEIKDYLEDMMGRKYKTNGFFFFYEMRC